MRATRLASNPIIVPDMDDRMGANINGPSLIRVPEWIDQPLGAYYLYFAHHEGKYIRLAYADDLEGPWVTYRSGVLDVAQSYFLDHIASPDVHVNNELRQIRMYFHGLLAHQGRPQGTRVALSTDGIEFRVEPSLLAPRPYLRAFEWNKKTYATTMSGVFWVSEDGLTPFEHMPWPGRLPTFAEGLEMDARGEWPGILPFRCRHVAVRLCDSRLLVIYSLARDKPEHLVYSWVELGNDMREWSALPPQDLLYPDEDWEGGDLPIRESEFGVVHERVRELRDPAIFEEDDRLYLLYSVAGEHGIGIAILTTDGER